MLPNGPPLIFLPGWLATGSWWARQADAFALDYSVLPVDYPASEGAGCAKPHNVEAYAEGIHTALTAFGRPAILVGWSLGAGVALRMVEVFGTVKLRALVLVDQTPCSLPGADWPHGVFGLDERKRISTLQMVAAASRPLPQPSSGPASPATRSRSSWTAFAPRPCGGTPKRPLRFSLIIGIAIIEAGPPGSTSLPC